MNAHGRFIPRQDTDEACESFRSAMRHLASGVSVITTGQGEHRSGLTATSVSSLSMEPPSLVVCINRASVTLQAMRETGVFGVSFLAAQHRDVAERFAGRGTLLGAARFEDSDWISLVTGAPLLSDALAAIDCSIDSVMEWNTHALVIGRVEAVHQPGGAQALLHWRCAYRDLPPDLAKAD
jgi:flavin reductase (DIM6/NTAB) family NADH-FMN oxidoreductase RutF